MRMRKTEEIVAMLAGNPFKVLEKPYATDIHIRYLDGQDPEASNWMYADEDEDNSMYDAEMSHRSYDSIKNACEAMEELRETNPPKKGRYVVVVVKEKVE